MERECMQQVFTDVKRKQYAIGTKERMMDLEGRSFYLPKKYSVYPQVCHVPDCRTRHIVAWMMSRL